MTAKSVSLVGGPKTSMHYTDLNGNSVMLNSTCGGAVAQ